MDTLKCLDRTLGFHGVAMPTFIKFYALKICRLLYVSKLSLKVKKKNQQDETDGKYQKIYF